MIDPNGYYCPVCDLWFPTVDVVDGVCPVCGYVETPPDPDSIAVDEELPPINGQ